MPFMNMSINPITPTSRRTPRSRHAVLTRQEYETAHRVTLSELKDIPADVREPLMRDMAAKFSKAWGEEDVNFAIDDKIKSEDDPNRYLNAYRWLTTQMESTDPYSITLVSHKGSTLVSTLGFAKRDSPSFDRVSAADQKPKYGDGFIVNGYTSEEFRGQGHFSHMMRFMDGIVQERKHRLPGFDKPWLWTKPGKNVEFYTKRGWTVMGGEYIPNRKIKAQTFLNVMQLNGPGLHEIDYAMNNADPDVHQRQLVAMHENTSTAPA